MSKKEYNKEKEQCFNRKRSRKQLAAISNNLENYLL